MILPALILATASAIPAAPAAPPAPKTPTYAHHAISTTDPQSQALFDRGLTLFYSYNGSGGVHVFQALEKREPNVAIAYWGEALSAGPDINNPMTENFFNAARTAIEKAAAHEGSATPAERVYIDAMRTRYAAPWSDHAKAEKSYIKAMAAAVEAYPADDDLGALYVETLLEDNGPFALWRAGTSIPAINDTATMVKVLDGIIARNPNHIMANHLNIHIFEFSTDRARAIDSAQRLDRMAFAPENEHLTHMTAHTWVDIGQYAKGVTASKNAIALFDTYLATPDVDEGHSHYIWHDIRVGWGASLMLSDYAEAQWFAKRLVANPTNHTPFEAFTAMRFGHWSDITGTPKDAADPLHYAIAYSKLRQGDAVAASSELSDALDTKTSGAYLLYALRGAIAALQHDTVAADKNFTKALAMETDNYSGENLPAIPTAEIMGATYYKLGDYAKAEKAYRQALQSYANDPYATTGLADTLKKLGTATPNAQ